MNKPWLSTSSTSDLRMGQVKQEDVLMQRSCWPQLLPTPQAGAMSPGRLPECTHSAWGNIIPFRVNNSKTSNTYSSNIHSPSFLSGWGQTWFLHMQTCLASMHWENNLSASLWQPKASSYNWVSSADWSNFTPCWWTITSSSFTAVS